jgi:hypothetical protein
MANVSIHFREPEEKFEGEAIALGAKVIEVIRRQSGLRTNIYLQCTHQQLKRVFSLREGQEIRFSTRLAEAKCKHVIEQFRGTVIGEKLSYGSLYRIPCELSGWVTTYDDYCLVMNAIKDVKG